MSNTGICHLFSRAPAHPAGIRSLAVWVLQAVGLSVAMALVAGCGYSVHMQVPLIPNLLDAEIYYSSHSSSSVRGRAVALDGAPVAGVPVRLHFEGYSWNGSWYEWVSFTQVQSTDAWGYFDLYIPSGAVVDYENLDHRHFELYFSAAPGYGPREDSFHGSVVGDPNLGTFVLPWGS